MFDASRRMLTTVAVAVVAFGCADPATGPLAFPDIPAFDVASPRVFVLNTQLRGIIAPDIEPISAWGHLQVKLTETDDQDYRVEWKGKLFNPDRTSFIGGGIFNPEADPDFRTVLFFFRGATGECDVLTFSSDGIINPEILPAEVALAMIINPDIHEVTLSSVDGGVVKGTFGALNPGDVVGFNPQPDPPAGRVRCEAL